MAQTIGHLFHSYTEPHLATDNELVRNILLALLASLAKVEAQKISERTKAGMARAKARASGSDGRSSGSNFARKLPKGLTKGRHLTVSVRLSASTGIPPRNTRSERLKVEAWKRLERRLIHCERPLCPQSDCQRLRQRFVAKGQQQTSTPWLRCTAYKRSDASFQHISVGITYLGAARNADA
jgi:hypothetical protein